MLDVVLFLAGFALLRVVPVLGAEMLLSSLYFPGWLVVYGRPEVGMVVRWT